MDFCIIDMSLLMEVAMDVDEVRCIKKDGKRKWLSVPVKESGVSIKK